MGKISSRSDASTRAEKKFEKKLNFYAKVRDTVAALTAQKAITKKKQRNRQKKLKAYDLSSLSEFLPELKASQEPVPTEIKIKGKTRQNLVLKESHNLRRVLNHPAFQSDPFGAIYQHLQSTQPTPDENFERKKSKDGKKKAKRKSRASSQPQLMEA